MREAERLAIKWCQERGLDPCEYVPFAYSVGDRREVKPVMRYLAISGGVREVPSSRSTPGIGAA